MKSVGRSIGLVLAMVMPFVCFGQEDVVIQSFDSTGQLTFTPVEHAIAYRIEWAASVHGPWTNFTGDAGAALDTIHSIGLNPVTVSVPMLYRVVSLTNLPPPAGMVGIPGGTNSGSDPSFGAYSLTVNSFYMDQYPVTRALWDKVYIWATHADRGADMYVFDRMGTGKAGHHPVHTVNWYDAVKWCNARSEMDGRPAVYTVDGDIYRAGQHDNVIQTAAAGYRLPTGVEWEYAARGGLASQRFPWGNQINHDHANYYASGNYLSYDTSPYAVLTYHPTYNDGTEPYTSPVGSFPATGYGLYDMVGNVRQWSFSWHPAYVGGRRMTRGGAWSTAGLAVRIGELDDRTPSVADNRIGFRAVLSTGP